MADDRADGPTFALDDICWIDFESRSQTPIKAGTYRYATEADAIVLAYAIGDAPVHTLWVRDFTRSLAWGDLPPELVLFYERVCCGEAVFAAWNAGFDRAIWNYATLGFPELKPHHIIDVMAQATASGLPADLNYASKFSGSTHKMAAGKSLIALFCLSDAPGTPQSHPDEWQAFLSYAGGDIIAMRDIFRRTRQLPLEEWQEYWAMEAINSRGIAVDLKMVEHAAKLAEQDRIRSRQQLAELTNGVVSSVDQVKVMTEWLLDRLPPAGKDIILKREEEINENQVITRPAKYSLTRKQVERLIALNKDQVINRVLQLRLYGGSKTPTKFQRILDGHVDGVLYGQYVFNGAAQTGRASSKGVQIHNLARDTLAYEHDAIEALLVGTDYDAFSRLGESDSSPVARKLSLLIRPAFVPCDSNVFVWSDWSQIEARVLPWLCDHLAGARTRLDIFRNVDLDPTLPDLYSLTAAQLSHVPITEVTKAMRQRGKVAELALGFCGGRAALQAMAAGYGMHFDDDEASAIVDAWRLANPWAGLFARELWDAMLLARNAPGSLVPAGRVGFCFLPAYLGGSLLCRLPSGRCLTYRALRREMVDEKDDDGKVVKSSLEWTYARGHGRQKLWPGIFVENCIAKGTLVMTEYGWMSIENITDERVWDGEEWVRHKGMVGKGIRPVIELDGSWMTPDHKVLTTEGWKNADSVGHNRKSVRIPDSCSLPAFDQWKASMADTLRLRSEDRVVGEKVHQRRLEILRLQDVLNDVKGIARETETVDADPQYVEAPGICGMAFDARSVSPADASGVAQLRRARDNGVSGMEDIRAVLGRYGTDLSSGINDRKNRQQQGLQPGELCVGHPAGASKQPTFARVYDLVEAGPRHRFVIAGRTAPTIVHNCTQAVAADILRGTLVRLEQDGLAPRLHTHDEVLVEVAEKNADLAAIALRLTMQLGFDWSEGLPLMSEETISPYYSKRA